MLTRIDVQNDPVNWIDPWGLDGISIGIGVGAGSSGAGTAIAVGAAQGLAVTGVGVAAYAATSAAIDGTWLDGGMGDWLYDQLHPDDPNVCTMSRSNRKKQGRELDENKRKNGNWVDNGNKRGGRKQKKHTPSKKHKCLK